MWKCLDGIVLLLNLTYYVWLCENKPFTQKSFDWRTPNSGHLEQVLHLEYQAQPSKLPLFSYYLRYNGTGWAQYLSLPLFRPNMATPATFGLVGKTNWLTWRWSLSEWGDTPIAAWHWPDCCIQSKYFSLGQKMTFVYGLHGYSVANITTRIIRKTFHI